MVAGKSREEIAQITGLAIGTVDEYSKAITLRCGMSPLALAAEIRKPAGQ